MTPGAAQSMLKSHGVVVGKKIIVAGTGPFLMPVATGLAKAGAEIVGLFDSNREYRWALNLLGLILNPSKIKEGFYYKRELKKFGLKIEQGKRIERFDGKSATVSGKYIECDVVAVGWGFVPEITLAGILGANLRVDSDGTVVVEVDKHQESSVKGLFVAGEVTGIGGNALSIVEGKIAGGASAAFDRWRMQLFARGLQRVYPVPADWQELLEAETTVCRCEEVKKCDLIKAIDDLGAEDGRTSKLFTRAGMGLCQGRICGRNVSEFVASQCGQELSDGERIRGTARPIAAPISLGELGDGKDGLEKKF
jgi:NADPH-dependent 2,4-dienoyl-CoA reductase/sulfur reductase-like enzyme